MIQMQIRTALQENEHNKRKLIAKIEIKVAKEEAKNMDGTGAMIRMSSARRSSSAPGPSMPLP
jgi:hypothetical protein